MTEKEAKKFYNSKEWKTKRIYILNRDRHECQDCRARIKKAVQEGVVLNGRDREIRRGTEVHHIQELRDYPELALDDDNLISLCTTCHNIRHGRNQYQFVKKKKKHRIEERW